MNKKAVFALAGLGGLFFWLRSREASAGDDTEGIEVEPEQAVPQQPSVPGFVPVPGGSMPPIDSRSQGLPPVVTPQGFEPTVQPSVAPDSVLGQIRAQAEATVPRIVEQVDRVISGQPVEASGDHETAHAPTSMPADTAALLAKMLVEESTSGWKHKETLLQPWQRARGLVDDGLFGPKSATAMAEETGLLPIVRYWPRNSTKSSGVLEDYKAGLLALAADADEPRASQLRKAVDREQGQGFARSIRPVTPTILFG